VADCLDKVLSKIHKEI